MMFQILGVPYLNQKAREVPPKTSSLTASGLYLLFSKKVVYFWMGSEYQARYTDVSKKRRLISDGLFLRLLTLYRKDAL